MPSITTSGPLALVTGSTGFIGSQVALSLLKAGYILRLSIRHAKAATKLRRILTNLDPGYDKSLEFVTVPDITASGAFDEAVQGVQFIVHVASPIPGGGPEGDGDLVGTAVKGTTSILESALKSESVRRIVITASVASLLPVGEDDIQGVFTEKTPLTTQIPPPEVLSTLPPMAQYAFSKVASYKATLDFIRDRTPHFDVITLHPVFVFGRSLIQESAAELGGTCALLYNALMGDGKPVGGNFQGVHVDDVAEAHVKALQVEGEDKAKAEAFLLTAPARSWGEVDAFVRGRYPNLAVQLKPEENQTYTIDASKAGSVLGISFKPMEEQVVGVMDQQLEFSKV